MTNEFPSPTSQTTFLTITEAAQRTGMSAETIRRLCKEGQLVGAFQEREGGLWHIPPEAIAAWDKTKVSKSLWQRFLATLLQHPVVLAIVMILGALAAVAQIQSVWFVSVPIPTATPLAFATATPSETLILIATFTVTQGNHDTLPQREIRDNIRAKIQELHENNLRVEVEPTVLTSDQQAEAKQLGERYGASMVIWGDDTGARVTVNFLNLHQPDFDASRVTISETVRTQLANPSAYAQFVTDDLPREMSFLALFAIGQAYYLNTKYVLAIERIEAAIAVLPPNATPTGLVEAYFRLGWLYQEPPENLDAAIINYDKAIKLKPDYAGAYNNRGFAYAFQHKLDTAITDFDKAIQLNPDFAIAYYNRGFAYALQHKLNTAITDFDKAIQLNPDFAEAYNNRGLARAYQHKLDMAIIDFDKAIQLNPALAEAYNNRGLAYQANGKLFVAITDYDKAIQLKPDDANLYNNRGNVHKDQGKLDEAIADYDKAIQLKPDYAIAFYNRGAAHKAKGDQTGALADYRRYLQIIPEAEDRIQVEQWIAELEAALAKQK